MEPLKHECGVAMIRLLKPLEYYREKYGTDNYALARLYLLMEKQHNRGQEGAGVACVRLDAEPGDEYMFRERAAGTTAITEIFNNVYEQMADDPERWRGSLFMGHLRYSTTGKSGLDYIHPFLRRNNWRAKNFALCGNFNLTNVDELFRSIVANGQHPRKYADTHIMLEQLGHRLDREVERVYAECSAEGFTGLDLTHAIEDRVDMARVLQTSSPIWDGGYVMCGMTGSGETFALRDPWGIRTAFWYADDEVIVLASERPVIQTVFNVPADAITELLPGQALLTRKDGTMHLQQINAPQQIRACSFERIYFSRGSDVDIYRERKEMGRRLVDQILPAIDYDIDHTVVSYIPNTAEVAFYGLLEGLDNYLNQQKIRAIEALGHHPYPAELERILSRRVRSEKVAIKDIKLRTFIAEGNTRNDLAAHVYDITYGSLEPGVDNLVIIDDSIVRGTTLRQSIISILDRLHPKKTIIVSSSPQIRYPDYYGIDMSSMEQFIAFRAAVALLEEQGRADVITDVYERCKQALETPPAPRAGGADTPANEGFSTDEVTIPPVLAEASVSPSRARGARGVANPVKDIYAPFTDEDINHKMVELLTPDGIGTKVEIIFQTIDGLHAACPDHAGDWYFTGDYPTPGGQRMLYRAFINWYEALSISPR